MTAQDLNPFAAPAARGELVENSDWELTTLRKGLKLWLFSLCAGMFIQLLRIFVGFAFGSNTNETWYLIYFVIQAASLLNQFVSVAASLNVFHAAPPVASRRIAAVVFLFTITAPIATIVLPIMNHMLTVNAFISVRIGEHIFGVICSISFLLLLRNIAKRFRQRDARGIAGMMICLEFGLLVLATAIVWLGAPMRVLGDLSPIYLLCVVGVLSVKGMVVYLLLSHLRILVDAKRQTTQRELQSVP